MSISDNIKQQFLELLSEGQKLISKKNTEEYWISDEEIAQYQQWLMSVVHLICIVDQPCGTLSSECKHLMKHDDLKRGIPYQVIQKMHGLLAATHEEWKRGLMLKVEHIVVAEAFDDFLDHAADYHKGNKKIESSILASAVLEDTVKRIARKSGINTQGVSLESLIDNLVKVDVFTPVKAKRVKAFAGVRNQALHAEWDKFDIRDVGELVNGTRELIDTFLES